MNPWRPRHHHDPFIRDTLIILAPLALTLAAILWFVVDPPCASLLLLSGCEFLCQRHGSHHGPWTTLEFLRSGHNCSDS